MKNIVIESNLGLELFPCKNVTTRISIRRTPNLYIYIKRIINLLSWFRPAHSLNLGTLRHSWSYFGNSFCLINHPKFWSYCYFSVTSFLPFMKYLQILLQRLRQHSRNLLLLQAISKHHYLTRLQQQLILQLHYQTTVQGQDFIPQRMIPIQIQLT